MPELDTLAYLQLAGLAFTWLAAVAVWFWRIKKSTGTDKDVLILVGMVGGFIFLTLVQLIGLMVRVG